MITQTVIDQLIKDQRGLCYICGRDLRRVGMQAHHAVYGREVRFAKYLDTIFNLVLLCPKCHNEHGRLSNIETRKKVWAWKVAKGYDMKAWADKLPMLIKDRFEEE